MKHLYVILVMVFAITWQTSYAIETEPNNTKTQANILALNSSDNGQISSGDTDWWKVTTNADGKLNLTLSNSSGKPVSVYLYDNNGSTLLTSGSSINTIVKTRDGLSAGIYYIKVKCDSTSDSANYTISNSLSLPVQANDTEPNDSKTEALTLALDGTTTGHVGYYYNKKRDTADWYKISTNKNGRLELKLTPVNGSDTRVYLYDNDGITLLNSKDSNVAFSLSTDGLAAGTYYVKINCTVNSKFTPYILSNSLITPVQANDAEPNNTKAQAVSLGMNSTKTGHVGYYYNNKRDTTDWYKIATNKDGKLTVKLTPVNGANVWAYLYDNNGTTLLSSKDSTIAFTISKDGLSAGTYYVKVNCTDPSKFTPYSLTSKLDTLIQPNDSEPNNSIAEAGPLTLDSTQGGHLGYYYNGKRDTTDWYKINTGQDGRLDLSLTPANGVNTWLYLYDNNGTTLLNSKDSGIAFTISTDGLAAGTYFIKINTSNNSLFTGYTLTNNLIKPAQAKDAEPNNSRDQATTLNLNSKKTGHVGYYYNKKRDTADWYKITTKVDTKLKLKLALTNGEPVLLSLYAGNGISLINSFSSGNSFSLLTDGLEDDVYYIKVNCKSPSGFAPYTLTDSIFAPPTTDTLILPLNYRITDTLQTAGDIDWFKVTTNADGRLDFRITPLSTKYIWLYLYDHDGTTQLAADYANVPFNVSKDGLAAGTYYVMMRSYYASDTMKYLLADTLRLPAQANDVEPNNNPAQALTLNVNSSKTGNIGYFYNNKRDTADWYKITTKADGLLKLYLTPVNNSFVFVNLYDNDGTTLLKSEYSNSLAVISQDGLAAGTYYIRVNHYYSNQFAPYILSDSLITPVQANDKEPNNSVAQALSLQVNGSTTGHIGYYNNNKRDTTDWYKITTTAEGLLNIKLTPVNGSYVFVHLYDSDGTTLIKTEYANVPFSVIQDGLAAGTFYIRVRCYYSYGFAPYILSNTLVKPALANDVEPNNTRGQALVLNVNSTTTGHVGYYNNKKRDTADWYKITTTKNGALKLNLTPANGSYIYAYLYDNNGTTLLNDSYSNGAFIQNTDGLAAGTYYVKINCYYNYQFTAYTLTDSLLTYSYANDTEPNNYAKQAKIVTPNAPVTGHVNFYYNLAKDEQDWWKLNYTGNGNLQFVFNLAPRKITGVIPHTYFLVYKDTLAAPIYNNYFNTATNVINLTSLAKGDYYIRIRTYYNYEFVTYSFSNSSNIPAPVMARGNALERETIKDKLMTIGYNVSIFPNPVSDRFHVQVNSKEANLASVSLRDATGKQVWSRSNLKIAVGGGLDVNVKNFPGGSYFLQMTDVNGNIVTKKIIIVK